MMQVVLVMKSNQYKKAWQDLKQKFIELHATKLDWKDIQDDRLQHTVMGEKWMLEKMLIEMDKADGTREFVNILQDLGLWGFGHQLIYEEDTDNGN
jgi:hypothetical protein